MNEKDANARTPPALLRISTGNTELDAILGGGFPKNSINIIMGEPGSGKTILVERLVFANAQAEGRPILYLTTLSEPLEKVVHYLQQFDFYEEEAIANGAVVYDSLGAELKEQGIAALVPKIEEAIASIAPKIIIIDSFKAIHDLCPCAPDMRRMLYDLSGMLTAYETTAFLLGEYNEAMISSLPEFAVADGMLELACKKESSRDERYLRVLKLRGSSYQEGVHAFRITKAGLEVFPRLTSPTTPSSYQERIEQVPTGITGLNKMLGGGLWAGGTTLVQGTTGAGKTTLALQFIFEGLGLGEAGLYVNFQENPTQLARQVKTLGWDLEDAKRRGLHCLYTSPVELQIDSILVALFRTIEQHNIKRLVIDAVGDLANGPSDHQRLSGYIYALAQHFVVRGITTVMTLELGTPTAELLFSQINRASDIIVSLGTEKQADQIRRTVRIVKARGINHDLATHELRISSQGIEVL